MMFMDYFGFFELDFEKNGLNHQNLGKLSRSYACGVETHVAAKAHAKAWHARGVAEWEVGQASGFAAT